MKHEQLHTSYEQLLSAAAGEGSFVNAVESMTGAFGGGGGAVFEMNRKTGIITSWVSRTLFIGDDAYSAHVNSINPRMNYSMRHATGHLVFEGRFTSDRSMDRHEFYDWLERFAGFRYFLGSRIYDDGDVSLFQSIEFARRHGHPDPAKIAAFGRASRAVGNAWRAAARRGPSDEHDPLAAWVPEHLPWSIFALSANGRVLRMNGSARTLVDRKSALSLEDGELCALDRISQDGLRRAIGAAISGVASETLVARRDGPAWLIVQLVPVNNSPKAGPVPIAALLYVSSSVVKARDISGAASRIWGFTIAEARLANILASGADLTEAAKRLGISRNTARNQLQRLFAKTGTRRQSELLVQILGVLET